MLRLRSALSLALSVLCLCFGTLAVASTVTYPYHLVADAGSYGAATATFKAQHALMAEARQTRIVERSDLRTDSNGFRLASAEDAAQGSTESMPTALLT
jgi:uncharacterized membrane protein YdbT with pleckstrin-like domain